MAEAQVATLPYFVLAGKKKQPDEIDHIIVAKLPDKDEDSALFDIVTILYTTLLRYYVKHRNLYHTSIYTYVRIYYTYYVFIIHT